MSTDPKTADPIALIRQLDDYAYKATLLGSLDSDAGRRNALLKFGEAFKKASAELARLHAALHEAQRILIGTDQPWPLADVLTRLADAADHLLSVHDCDTHGWEGIVVARDKAREYADAVRGRQASGIGRTDDKENADGLLGSTVPEDPWR